MPEFQKSYGRYSEAQVANAERKLGIDFPGQYRSFLLTNGGGSLAESWVVPNTDASALLSQFWDIDSLVEMQGLGFNEVVPREYLIIGAGSGGGLCVKTTGEDIGSVWWANYDLAERIDAEEPTEEVMDRLADTFDEFIRMVP